MNIFVLIATLSLNYFANKAKQTKTPLAPAVTMALYEYSLLSPPFLKAVKGHLPRLGEAPLVAHALPQVATPAKYSSLGQEASLQTLSGLKNRLAHSYSAQSLNPTESLIL
jgi:hypothetical protein